MMRGTDVQHMFSDILSDPLFGSEAFVIRRKTYNRSLGEAVLSGTEHISASGCIHPAGSVDLQLLPEEVRSEEVILVRSQVPLLTGSSDPASAAFTAPDEILRNGEVYRVIRVKDWSGFGFCQAWAVKQREGSA